MSLPRTRQGCADAHLHKCRLPPPASGQSFADKWRRTKLAIAQSKHLRQTRHLCQKCGIRLAEELHHIQPLHQAPHLAGDPANHLAVCRECHKAIHHGG